MRDGENGSRREPEPPNVPRDVARRLARLSPEQLERLDVGLDVLHDLRTAAGVRSGVSTQTAINTGRLSAADVWAAFGLRAPERGAG